ncbi:MAG: hypothetical protein V5A23_00420 [Halobacteriales archaeon]
MDSTVRSAVGVSVVGVLHWATLPGVVMHELAHQFVAELFDLRVTEVDYTSHVQHETPRSLVQAVLVAVAPLVVNTAFGAAALYLAADGLPYSPSALSLAPFDVAMAFLAFALFFRAIPSLQDIANVFAGARRRLGWRRPQVLLGLVVLAPVLAPLYVGLWVARATGTRVVVDLGYAGLAFAALAGVSIGSVPAVV